WSWVPRRRSEIPAGSSRDKPELYLRLSPLGSSVFITRRRVAKKFTHSCAEEHKPGPPASFRRRGTPPAVTHITAEKDRRQNNGGRPQMRQIYVQHRRGTNLTSLREVRMALTKQQALD